MYASIINTKFTDDEGDEVVLDEFDFNQETTDNIQTLIANNWIKSICITDQEIFGLILMTIKYKQQSNIIENQILMRININVD